MNQIGFRLCGSEENDSNHEKDTKRSVAIVWEWLEDTIFNSLPHFTMIYGIYACIRDLITSLF